MRSACSGRRVLHISGYQNKKKAIMDRRPGGVEEFDPPVKTGNKAAEYSGGLLARKANSTKRLA